MNFNDTIGNRTSDHLARSAVPQPTASPQLSSDMTLIVDVIKNELLELGTWK